jgi:hypothetical protein
MKRIHAAVAVAVALSLAGCAGSVSAPTPIQSLSVEQKASLRLSGVSADAAAGVDMRATDFEIVCEKVRTYIQAAAPGVFADAAGGKASQMKIHFTQFDRGNAFARAMLAGLGQIRIEATVYIIDPSGQQVGQYEVSKDFSFGGIYGAATTVEDVEDGFAKSVAEIVKTKP